MLTPRPRLRGDGDLRNATPINSATKVVMTVEVSIHVRSPAYALCVSNGHLPSNHMATSSIANISWTTRGADQVAVRQAPASSGVARVNEGIGVAFLSVSDQAGPLLRLAAEESTGHG